MKIKDIYYYYPKKTVSNVDLEKNYPSWKIRELTKLTGVKKKAHI